MDSPWLACSDRIYRLLLRAYPASFRARFAAETAQVFRTLCCATYAESGGHGLAWLWLAALWDWAWTGVTLWGQHLLKRRTNMTQTNFLNRSDGVKPLSAAETWMALLPFLGFGLVSLVNKLDVLKISSLPLWQILIIEPFLLFNWLVLIGLFISLLKGFPRWGYAYLGWAILFGWWWSDMRFFGYKIGGGIWLPLLGVVVLALLLRRSIQPLRTLLSGLWQEWTLLSFAVYILYAHVFMLYDENHNPYLLALVIATTLTLGLGVWGYFRSGSPLRRMLALSGALALQMVIGFINGATWDYRTYYGVSHGTPENDTRIAIIFFIVLSLIMLANGLLAAWWSKRQDARQA